MSRTVASARFAAVFVLLFSIACSSSASNGTATTAKPASGPVTLTIWAMGDEGDKLGNSDVLQGFQTANPDIKVEVTSIPWTVAHDKLITAVAGKQTPDITALGTTWAGEFDKLNVLDPVPSTISPDQFYQGAIDA